ncbi:Uncharacterised protein [Burkholderia pseudomallei]|nr:Uncharacterised protein [Burkholderia pseudomallei]
MGRSADDGAFRADACRPRASGRYRVYVDLCDVVVRSSDGRALSRPLAPAARRNGDRCGSRRHRPAAARRSRARAGTARLERNRPRVCAGCLPPSVVRSPGIANAGSGGGDLRRRDAELYGPRRACESPRALPARTRRRAGHARGAGARARCRDDDGIVGGPEGGRCICAAGPGLCVGALARDPGRQPAGDRAGGRGGAHGAGCAGRCAADCGPASGCVALERVAFDAAACRRPDAAPPCLCDLHVGLDGTAEGGDGRARKRGESVACAGRGDLPRASERTAREPERIDRVRFAGQAVGAVAVGADAGGGAGAGAFRREASARCDRARPDRRLRLHAVATGVDRGGARAGGRSLSASDAGGGRGDRRRDVVGVGERIEPDVLQRVWSDGMHGGCDARADHGGACAAHRRAAGERAGLCVERAVEPGAGGRARGALHRRGGRCTRVLEPAGADAGAVHRRSVRGGRAAV